MESIRQTLRTHRSLLLIFFLAFLFRIILTPFALNGDLLTQSEWGLVMYTHTPKVLYDWGFWLNEWPNHPPLISLFYFWAYQIHSFLMMVMSNLGNFIALHRLAPTKFLWFFKFIEWYGSSHFQPGNFLQGIVVTIKFEMIIADLAIAGLIYHLCQKAKVNWRKYVILYLALPFSWYLSALWGQSDQVAYLFLISSFITLNSRYYPLSPLLFGLSINLKPTGLILIPIYLLIVYKNRLSFPKIIFGLVISLLANLLITSFTTNRPLYYFVVHQLIPQLFSSKKAFTTVSAFNFWYIFHAKDMVPQITRYLSIPSNYWGYLAYFFINIYSYIIIRPRKLSSILAAVFTSAFGGWLFMTNMYERYLFTGVVSLLFLSIYRPRYYRYFIILSFIYLANMFNGWWYPHWFTFGQQLFMWHDRLVTRALSLVNIIIYLKILLEFYSDFKHEEK